MTPFRIDRLRDINELAARLEVEYPVPTSTGPKTLDGDEDVEVAIHLPGSVTIRATIQVHHYARLAAALEAPHSLPLPLDAPA